MYIHVLLVQMSCACAPKNVGLKFGIKVPQNSLIPKHPQQSC